MTDPKLNIEKAFEKAFNESKEYLDSMSALELMLKSGDFQRRLITLVNSLRLPAGIIVGVLTSEVYRVLSEADELKYLSAFELFKKYVDETYMKKE